MKKLSDLQCVSAIVIISIIAAIAASMAVNSKPAECLERRTVKTILEVKYRDAVVELDNGTVITVNQGSPRARYSTVR